MTKGLSNLLLGMLRYGRPANGGRDPAGTAESLTWSSSKETSSGSETGVSTTRKSTAKTTQMGTKTIKPQAK